MPLFKYEAVDHKGRNLRGTTSAPDEPSLEKKLKEAGLWLTEAVVHNPVLVGKEPADHLKKFKLSGRAGRRELIDFCTLMTFQLRVGIPLVQALDVACQDCKNYHFRDVLRDLQRQIESGLQFHEAMEKYPGVFSAHFVSVIRAGEISSKLPESFLDLRAYLEWVDQINAEVRQASLYPSIVSIVVFAFTVFLFSFIIPKFAALLKMVHVQQPLLTRIVLGVGGFAKATWWLWVSLLLLLVIGIPVGRRLSKRFSLMIDLAKLHGPVFGELNLMLALSRFSHNLSILYVSGVPILQALRACQSGLIGNSVVEQAVAEVEAEVRTGSTIGEAMHRQPVFPPLLLRMVSMGEASGNLDAALQNVSQYYNEVIPRRIKAVFSIVEPMLMLFLIFMVGCVALAIYLPIISLYGSIK